MKVIPLSEGTFTVDKTKLFVPFNEEEDKLQNRPTGSLLVEIQPFVVITSKDVLLLDSGLGFRKNDILQLDQNLLNNGINPSEVTKILSMELRKSWKERGQKEKWIFLFYHDAKNPTWIF